jgi:hypothetical protein
MDQRAASATPPTQTLGRRAGRLMRNWWPVAAFLAPVLVAQAIWQAQYDVSGHAAGHLSSATAVFPMVFVSAVLLWALPGRARRDPLLWLLLITAVAGCLVVLAGNVRVVDAIGGETWSDEQASLLGATRQGFESGHDLAQQGALGAVVATVLAAGLLWRRRLTSAKVAAGAAVLSVIFPYWMAPGFGIVVLVVAAVVARARSRPPYAWSTQNSFSSGSASVTSVP